MLLKKTSSSYATNFRSFQWEIIKKFCPGPAVSYRALNKLFLKIMATTTCIDTYI